MRRIVRLCVFLSLSLLVFVQLGVSVSAGEGGGTLKKPSGMIVKDENNSYYYTYYLPGTGYSEQRLKYIGQSQVLDYYLKRGRKVYPITNAERSFYTIHNHGLGMPCGQPVRDNNQKIYFMEPLGWPPGAQDQADPVFSYSENFGKEVQYVNWSYPGATGAHHQDILKTVGYTQIQGVPIGGGLIYPFGVPNCVIVKQSGTGDYYRVVRHQQPDGTEIERKMKIATPEMLNLWANFNNYTYQTDITSLPNAGNVKMPPGLLVRTVADPTIYFTDDEGQKVLIPTLSRFTELGFSVNDVTFVSQSTIDSTPTKNIY